MNYIGKIISTYEAEVTRGAIARYNGDEASIDAVSEAVLKAMANGGEQQADSPVTTALDKLRNLGYRPKWNPASKSITFFYFGNKVTLYPKKGYFNGKGLNPGFGIDNLIDQLKERPQPDIRYE